LATLRHVIGLGRWHRGENLCESGDPLVVGPPDAAGQQIKVQLDHEHPKLNTWRWRR
jgi:hypothetical protein